MIQVNGYSVDFIFLGNAVVHLGFVMPSFPVNESESSVSVCVSAEGELARDVVVKVFTENGSASGLMFLTD